MSISYICAECGGFMKNWICQGCGADWTPDQGDPGDEDALYLDDVSTCAACGGTYGVDTYDPPDYCPLCNAKIDPPENVP